MKSNTLFLGIVSCSGSQANAPGDSTIVTKKLTLARHGRRDAGYSKGYRRAEK